MYRYNAVVTAVYDGDTITADVDLGFKTWVRGEKIRLSGINAPEVRGDERPGGLESRDWLRKRLLGKTVVIETNKDRKGKYGRYIATIFLDGININDLLVVHGLAEERHYL